MKINEVIKKAIEAGYKSPCCNREIKLVEHLSEHIEKVLLDTLFWSSLGKAMGWYYCRFHSMSGSESEAEMCEDCKHDQWLKEWHRFIDHLAEGKSIEDFFKDL